MSTPSHVNVSFKVPQPVYITDGNVQNSKIPIKPNVVYRTRGKFYSPDDYATDPYIQMGTYGGPPYVIKVKVRKEPDGVDIFSFDTCPPDSAFISSPSQSNTNVYLKTGSRASIMHSDSDGKYIVAFTVLDSGTSDGICNTDYPFEVHVFRTGSSFLENVWKIKLTNVYDDNSTTVDTTITYGAQYYADVALVGSELYLTGGRSCLQYEPDESSTKISDLDYSIPNFNLPIYIGDKCTFRYDSPNFTKYYKNSYLDVAVEEEVNPVKAVYR